MKYRLLELLCCPACGGSKLEVRSFRSEIAEPPAEIIDGILICANCGKIYPVVAGIPRMLPDSFAEYYPYLSAYHPNLPKPPGTDEEAARFKKLHKSTQESFSFEWLRYQVTDFEENLEFFGQATGLAPADLRGKLVLDAGCGMGRFIEVAASWGAEVVGLDLSRSVDRAWRETSHRARIHLVQGDIMRPPLKPSSFDFIYSIGVLHHTPNTRLAFRSLCPLLRPEGKIAIWVYRTFQPEIEVAFYKRAFAWPAELICDGTRLFTTRMPHRLLHCLCYAAVPLGWLQRKIYAHQPLKYIFWPLLLLPISSHEKWQVRLCETFDWLSPRYQWKHTTREVIGWFQAEGLTQITPLDKAVSVAGVKPTRRMEEAYAAASEKKAYAAE